MLLEVKGHLATVCLTQWAAQHHSVLGRLWHLSKVVERAAHDPWIGDDARGCRIEPRKVKIILD